MQRIDLGYWYKLGVKIHPLTELSGSQPLQQIFLKLYFANAEIETLLPQMTASYSNAIALSNALAPILRLEDMSTVLEAWRIANIASLATQFETALNAELSIQPCYHVTPKGGYNVDILTLAPTALFPADIQIYIDNIAHDIEQLGKCLAFEVPTAAGFHMHRINEAVLRKYWDVFTKNAPHPDVKTMGIYLTRLKKRKKKEAKLLAVLTQIKDLHRNPCLHPEVQLSVEDAIELYGIIRSSVTRMLSTIRKG